MLCIEMDYRNAKLAGHSLMLVTLVQQTMIKLERLDEKYMPCNMATVTVQPHHHVKVARMWREPYNI